MRVVEPRSAETATIFERRSTAGLQRGELALAYVVDDEPAMLDIVTFALETQDLQTEGFASAEDAWRAFTRREPHLLVLDVMLPGRSGVDLCHQVRAVSSVPIILVTARSATADRLAGLEAGADDYVVKPFHPRELALRAQALVRRSQGMRQSEMSLGPLVVHPLRSRVLVDGASVALTPHEYAMLLALMAQPGEPISFRQLLAIGWGEADRLGGRDLVKTAMYRMRLKLDAASPGSGRLVVSVRGVGYALRDPESW